MINREETRRVCGRKHNHEHLVRAQAAHFGLARLSCYQPITSAAGTRTHSAAKTAARAGTGTTCKRCATDEGHSATAYHQERATRAGKATETLFSSATCRKQAVSFARRRVQNGRPQGCRAYIQGCDVYPGTAGHQDASTAAGTCAGLVFPRATYACRDIYSTRASSQEEQAV